MFCLNKECQGGIYLPLEIQHRCFPFHILTSSWWGKTAKLKFSISRFPTQDIFLTLWIHVDRHTWWASRFLQSQKFLRGLLDISSPSLHIKHSDISVEEEERIDVMSSFTLNQRLIPDSLWDSCQIVSWVQCLLFSIIVLNTYCTTPLSICLLFSNPVGMWKRSWAWR